MQTETRPAPLVLRASRICIHINIPQNACQFKFCLYSAELCVCVLLVNSLSCQQIISANNVENFVFDVACFITTLKRHETTMSKMHCKQGLGS